MAGRWRSSLAIFRAGDADDNLCFAAMRDAGRGYYWEEVWKLLGETWQQQVMAGCHFAKRLVTPSFFLVLRAHPFSSVTFME
jgi:hypothetical protein